MTSLSRNEGGYFFSSGKMTKSGLVLDRKGIAGALSRMAKEILDKNHSSRNLGLVGIRSRGAYLAERLAKIIGQKTKTEIPLGFIDITLYRDDIGSKIDQPVIQKTELLFDVVNKTIILVDDVLFTGRTIRAALDELIDFGRPKAIQLAVLIDRGNRELPIQPDFVGKSVATDLKEEIIVKLSEMDGEEGVFLKKVQAKKTHAAKK